jgi:hypothetical protein
VKITIGLYRHAPEKDRVALARQEDNDMRLVVGLKSLSVLMAVSALGICILQFGQLSGIAEGSKAALNLEYRNGAEIVFGVGGPNYYELIGDLYLWISSAITVYIFLAMISIVFPPKQLAHLWVYFVGSIGCLLIAIYNLRNVFRAEIELLNVSEIASAPYYDWLNRSLRLDWILVFLIGVVVLTEIFVLIYGQRRVLHVTQNASSTR